MIDDRRSDTGGIIVSLILIAFGGLALYDAGTYSDPDSAAFPRAVAMALIGFSILAAAVSAVRGTALERPTRGSIARRVLFVAAMLASALLMPWAGFLISAFITFSLVMLAAMHDQWTGKRMLVYALTGLIVVVGAYMLFRYGLKVPLPAGRWLST